MRELTRAEAQIMQILWIKEKCTVHDIISEMTSTKPAYNTVSTIVRILVKKGFLNYNVFGKSHVYFSIIPRDAYRSYYLNKMLTNYFDGSLKGLLSFYMAHQTISKKEILNMLESIDSVSK